jgi:hypothetical protein
LARGFEDKLAELYEQFQRSECSFGSMAEQLGVTTWALYALLERRGLRTTNLSTWTYIFPLSLARERARVRVVPHAVESPPHPNPLPLWGRGGIKTSVQVLMRREAPMMRGNLLPPPQVQIWLTPVLLVGLL